MFSLSITAGYGFTVKCKVNVSKEKLNVALYPTPYPSEALNKYFSHEYKSEFVFSSKAGIVSKSKISGFLIYIVDIE